MGSPPRVREKLLAFFEIVNSPRITPACAGKTVLFSSLNSCMRDHPRVCGKNSLTKTIDVPRTGSPPRVREKPFLGRTHISEIGITPACAGKTIYWWPSFLDRRDHPRVCGKNTCACELPPACVGSPPRVREKLVFEDGAWSPDRITPACAGKTQNIKSASREVEDHPRVCGKNKSWHWQPYLPAGSPPRVREKQGPKGDQGIPGGITPACAGKTTSDEYRKQKQRDHPRVCGKNFNFITQITQCAGSPPRVREKLR